MKPNDKNRINWLAGTRNAERFLELWNSWQPDRPKTGRSVRKTIDFCIKKGKS
jgi:hypothetical protein